MSLQEFHSVELVDDVGTVSFVQIVSCTHNDRSRAMEMVEAGLLDPVGADTDQWRFAARDLRRAHTAQRLMDDLGINLAGVALILDLLEERDALMARIDALEKFLAAD